MWIAHHIQNTFYYIKLNTDSLWLTTNESWFVLNLDSYWVVFNNLVILLFYPMLYTTLKKKRWQLDLM